MRKKAKRVRVAGKNSCAVEKRRIKQAEARAALAEARTEQAKSRIEQAETRIEFAETRTERAKTRAEHAEMRAEEAEMALKQILYKEILEPDSIEFLKNITGRGPVKDESSVEKLSNRQREVLRLIAEGRNTKQIGGILKISPKTVEYHRMKLMKLLKLHDIPGLVRFALRVGLVPHEH